MDSNLTLMDLGGTLRTAKPQDTLLKMLPLAKKIGITRLANVTGLDSIGMPTWLAVRPLAKSLTVSQGKGITNDLAKVSALMESVELYHAEEFVPTDTYSSLHQASNNTNTFVDPLLLPLKQSKSINVNEEFEWTEASGYFSEKTFFIPRHMVCMDGSLALVQPTPFVSSSNGLASGNNIQEAVLHAALEVIERDQLSFWLISTLKTARSKTRIDLKTINNSICNDLLDEIDNAGLNVAIWYATTTLPIPVFVCTVFDSNNKTVYSQRASGYGCHPFKHIALSRAITEAIQSRLTHISGSRDDSGWLKYTEDLPTSSPKNQAWSNSILLEPVTFDYSIIPECEKRTTADEYLADIQGILYNSGMGEILYLNLTQLDVGIDVCHVTIPNIEYNANKDHYTPGKRMIHFLNTTDY